MSNKIFGTLGIQNKKGYAFYKKDYKASEKYKCKTYQEWRDIHDAIWEEISDQVVESKGGVFIKKLGYFAIMMSPRRRKVYLTTSGKYTYNDHTTNHPYHMTLFTNLIANTKLKYWVMDRGYSSRIRKKVYRNLKKGKKYMLKYTLLKKLYLGKETHTRDYVINKNK